MIPNVKLPDDCEHMYGVNGTVISERETTLAHELRALGYHTSFVGKWHGSSEIAMMRCPLSGQDLYAWQQQRVKDRGFDEAEGVYFTNVPQLRTKLGPSIEHHQEWLTHLAVKYIRDRAAINAQQKSERTRKPFFLVMASTLPHGPDLPLWLNSTPAPLDGSDFRLDLKTVNLARSEAKDRCQGIDLKNGFEQMVKYRHPSIRWLVQYIALKGNECAKLALFDDAVGHLVRELMCAPVVLWFLFASSCPSTFLVILLPFFRFCPCAASGNQRVRTTRHSSYPSMPFWVVLLDAVCPA